jgi:hypothetical protein
MPAPYFECGGITLYHGDCREILPELQSETFDMVLTDPSHIVSYSCRWGSEWCVIEGDSDIDSEWVEPTFAGMWRVLKPNSLLYLLRMAAGRSFFCVLGATSVSAGEHLCIICGAPYRPRTVRVFPVAHELGRGARFDKVTY